MYSRWFPKKERSKLVSFSFNGSNAGVAIAYPFGGYFAYKWGWQAAFYASGDESYIYLLKKIENVKNLPLQSNFIQA